MKTLIFKTMNALFEFDQKDVGEIILGNRSKYDLDVAAKLLDLISADSNERIIIPEEPVYFDYIAMDLIAVYRPVRTVV